MGINTYGFDDCRLVECRTSLKCLFSSQFRDARQRNEIQVELQFIEMLYLAPFVYLNFILTTFYVYILYYTYRLANIQLGNMHNLCCFVLFHQYCKIFVHSSVHRQPCTVGSISTRSSFPKWILLP